MIYGVVLAGGKGERFWPLSRSQRPKQFLKLVSGKMMLEETVERVLPLIPLEQIRIVTSEGMSEFILDNIDYLKTGNILREPRGRNTASAIGLAAVHLFKADPEALMVVLSADHLIRPADKLLSILKAALDVAAREDSLITIGVVPTRPETAYGYIKLGELYRCEGDYSVHHVTAFTEKPKVDVAYEYYYSNKYLWNSGMFVWSAKSILTAIGSCHGELGRLLDEYIEKIGTSDEVAARNSFYERAMDISIDFAVLEKAKNVLTIKADMVWDDVGDWRALERYKERDSENNVVSGETIMMDTYETTVFNTAEGIIACLGVSDLIIVRADNITLVAHRTKSQEIKKLLATLEKDENLRRYL